MGIFVSKKGFQWPCNDYVTIFKNTEIKDDTVLIFQLFSVTVIQSQF